MILRTLTLTSFILFLGCGGGSSSANNNLANNTPTNTPGGGSTSATLDFNNGQAASLVLGQTDFTGNGFATDAESFSSPYSARIGSDGRVRVLDQNNNRILGFNTLPAASGTNADFVLGQSSFTTSTIGHFASTMSSPAGVTDNGSQYFVTDTANSRILVYNTAPAATNQAADFSIGSASPGVAGTNNTCTTVSTAGLTMAFATTNFLLVTDSFCNRVTVFALPITGNLPSAVLVLGQTSFTASSTGTSASSFANPLDVWSDGIKIAVADGDNHRVLLWNSFPSTNGKNADVVVGQLNFTSNSTAPSNSTFNNVPTSVASNGSQLFVVDTSANRILIWNSWPTANGQVADRVLGQTNFSAIVPGTSSTTLNGPTTVSVSGSALLATDGGNNRVMVWKTN